MTSYSYARGDESSTRTGGVILAIAATLSAILVIAGLVYLTGNGPRHQSALAAAGCEPNLSPDPSDVPCTTVWQIEGSYTTLTTTALKTLNAEAAAFTADEGNNLAAAESDLKAEVTSATALATSLARFPFSAFVAPRAKVLVQAIQARVKLLAEQARSSTIGQLESFNAQIDAGSGAIETDLNLLHTAVFTRPTAVQEP